MMVHPCHPLHELHVEDLARCCLSVMTLHVQALCHTNENLEIEQVRLRSGIESQLLIKWLHVLKYAISSEMALDVIDQ